MRNHLLYMVLQQFSHPAKFCWFLVFSLCCICFWGMVCLLHWHSSWLPCFSSWNYGPHLLRLLSWKVSLALHLFLTCMLESLIYFADGYVSWSTVVIWGCLCSSQFFSTGHHATITAIRWESAYNGFHGDFDTYSIPAFLIGLNTFTSYVIGVFALPLLLYWPYFRGRLIYTFEKEKEESSRGEFALNEEPKKLNQSLFKLFIAFLLFFAIKVST